MSNLKTYETPNTTFYEIKFIGTKEKIKDIIVKFVHNNNYELDTEGDGLFYSCFDYKSIAETCFSYVFPDEETVKVMCWLKFRGVEYKIGKKFLNHKVESFRKAKAKEFKQLIDMLRR